MMSPLGVTLKRYIGLVAISAIVSLFGLLGLLISGHGLDPIVVAVVLAVATLSTFLSPRMKPPLSKPTEDSVVELSDVGALLVKQGELAGLRRRLETVERLAIAGELAAKVAHEIKNPLAPIKGYAQMLEVRLASVDETERPLFAKGLRIIRLEADNIDARVRALLERSRPTFDRPYAGTFEVNALVQEAVAVLEGTPSAPKTALILAPGLPRAHGDADEIRSALVNVLRNAMDAMASASQGSTIQISTGLVGGGRLLIEVKDQGIGLSTLDESRLFQAFYTTKRDGTGLGLAIARTAIEGAGGSIRLEDRADIRGAVVSIELPMEGAPKAS